MHHSRLPSFRTFRRAQTQTNTVHRLETPWKRKIKPQAAATPFCSWHAPGGNLSNYVKHRYIPPAVP